VVLTSAVFGAAHLPGQGWAGAEQALLTGAMAASAYAVLGRLWPIMWAHVAFDVAAVAIIYWDLETRIAHLVFR
jgi:hypothetical protein